MSIKALEILKQLKKLSLVETAELVRQVEDTFGVDATSQSRGLFTFSSCWETISQSETEGHLEFDIVLETVPADKKIAILKVIRSITGLGLKEAKDFVETVPNIIKSGITKTKAEQIKKQLEEVGAKVLIK